MKSGFSRQSGRGTDTGQAKSDVLSATGGVREPKQFPYKAPYHGIREVGGGGGGGVGGGGVVRGLTGVGGASRGKA